MNAHSPQVLLTAAQLRARFGGISDMSLWRWLHHPEMAFPQPIVIQRRRYWREDEIARWQASQTVSATLSKSEAA